MIDFNGATSVFEWMRWIWTLNSARANTTNINAPSISLIRWNTNHMDFCGHTFVATILWIWKGYSKLFEKMESLWMKLWWKSVISDEFFKPEFLHIFYYYICTCYNGALRNHIKIIDIRSFWNMGILVLDAIGKIISI